MGNFRAFGDDPEAVMAFNRIMIKKELEIHALKHPPAPEKTAADFIRDYSVTRAQADLDNPKYREEMRILAWNGAVAWSWQIPRDKDKWPDGVTAESFIKTYHGLGPDDQLLKPPAAVPVTRHRTFLDDLEAKPKAD
jgi:hypothetical protein